MSTELQITRIRTARDKLRAKGENLGVSLKTDNLTAIAEKFDKIANNGSVSATVQEGETYKIPKGYHNGAGTVSGVSGGGNYTLQSKPAITPTKDQIDVTPDPGFYGMSDVTIAPIPDTYQDVTSVTATAADVLANKVIVTKDGSSTPGTMPNNGAASKTLDASSISYKIPKGYHNGLGEVNIVLETKNVIPSKEVQKIPATGGKVISNIVVNPIPPEYITTGDATATADAILVDNSAYVAGKLVEGTMPNNGSTSKSMDGLTVTSVSIPAGYTTGGTISLTDDIEKALAEI